MKNSFKPHRASTFKMHILVRFLAITLATVTIWGLASCKNPTDPPMPTVVDITAIQGVAVPTNGKTPVTDIIENTQYSGTVSWNDNPANFAASTVYTATITLTAKAGYTLQGVRANFFTVTGATSVSNDANSGIVTAVFPETAANNSTAADYNISGLTQTYDGNPKTVTVTSKTGKSSGAITVKYNDSTTAPSDAGSYTVTFDVMAVAGWNAANGLPAGILLIGNATSTAADFDISGTGTHIFDGSTKTVTITPKTGKSTGTITVKYNGSTTVPSATGVYTVTFDVAAITNWNAAIGLPAGNLSIGNATPTADNFEISGIGTFAYDGSTKTVTITPKTGKSTGTITVKYNGSTTIPSAAGVYTVTFDVAANLPNWNAASGLSAGTITINAKSVTITGLGAANKIYNGNATATVTGTAAVNGRVGSDSVTVSSGVAAFADKNIGTGKTVTFSGYSLGGTAARNYSLSAQPASVTANITARALTITGVAAINRTYDGTATVALSGGTLSGVENGDTVSFTLGSGTLTDTNAGNAKTVTTAIMLTGTDAGNYTLTQPSNITVNITKAAGATVSTPTLNTKTYNNITINPVNALSNGQAVEYAINTVNTTPSIGWQIGTTFSGLNEGTSYYIFTRAAENGNYETGTASSSLAVTTLQTVSTDRIEYYWVNQHGNLVTTSGGITAVIPGATLTITAQGTGYVVKQWYVNGVNTSQSGNTYNFSSTTLGKHIVSLVVEKDGNPYNTNITITVATGVTITFSVNSGTGTVPVSQTVPSGSSTTIPSGIGLSRSGYTFGGWNTNTTGTGTNYNAGSSYTPTDNVTLYARWIADVTVTFNVNNGTGTVPASQTVPSGSSITIPSEIGLSRNGYTFGGWNTNTTGTGTNYNAGSSYTPTSNVTLYARWISTVTFNVNNGTGTTPASQTVSAGSSITLPSGSGLSRSGYTFNGWNTNTTGTGSNYNAGSSYTPTGSITLYATWSIGSEANTFLLRENAWYNITDNYSSTCYFLFYATSGTTYYIWWNDSYQGSGKTMDIKVDAAYSSGTAIFTGVDSAWSSPRSFTATQSGTVKIKTYPYSSGNTGTYAIVYSTSSTRP